MTKIEKEIVGAGGGKKSGSSADNTLISSATARIVEAISEGPIVGLVNGPRSIYLDETPLVDSDSESNFGKARWQQRKGLPDDEHLNGMNAVETVNDVSASVENDLGPVVRSVTNADADAVRVIIRINALFKIDDKGNSKTSDLHYQIDVRPYAGAWETRVNAELVNEKCTSAVQRSHRIELPVNGAPWDVRVTRVTPDSTDEKDQSSMTFESFTTLIEGRFTYPHTALIALEVEGEVVGQSVPQRAYHVMGRIISVPDNYNSVARTYDGIWTGDFIQAWTNNPAWIFYDLLENSRYGVGEHISATELATLKWQLYTIGQYCDQLVPSGFNSAQGASITEPRFTFNGAIRDRKEAFHTLQMITTSFRGMGYWALGQIFATADIPADPVKLVTPSNVISGRFNYSSTATKARPSVVFVTWNNPNDFYRSDVEMIVDEQALRRYGWREKRVDMNGCTSRGLAHRYGKWILDVENNETETVEYSASFDHIDVVPGDVIAVADPRKATVRMGGRIVSHTDATGGEDLVILDSDIQFQNGEDYILWLTMTDGSLTQSAILSISEDTKQVRISSGTRAEIGSVFIITGTDVQPRQYRVISTGEPEENVFKVTALFHDPNKYARVEENVSFQAPIYSREIRAQKPTNFSATEIAYIDGDGVTRSKVRLTWKAVPGVVVREYVVQVDTPTTPKMFATSTKNNNAEFSDLESGDYIFYVTTVDRNGNVSQQAKVSFTVSALASIGTGLVEELSLADASGSTEFFGRDVRLTWKNSFPASTGSAPENASSGLYDYNQVSVYHDGTGTLLRQVAVRGQSYTYTYEQNQRDTAATSIGITACRDLRCYITVVSKTGVSSTAVSLYASNPVPTAPTPSIVVDGVTVRISSSPSADTDIRGVKIWIEDDTSFDPDVATPEFDGAGSFFTWQGTPGATYYTRVGYYDYFDDTVSVSSVSSFTLGTLSGSVTVPEVPVGLALSTQVLSATVSSVTVAWTANSEDDISGYDILISENGGGEVGYKTPTTSVEVNVTAGATITARVRAVGLLPSGYSSTVSINAAASDVDPSIPTGLVATGMFNGVWLEWDVSADPNFSFFEIERRDNDSAPSGGSTPSHGTVEKFFFDGGLSSGDVYYYWIRQNDKFGNRSEWTAVSVEATVVGVEAGAITGSLVSAQIGSETIYTSKIVNAAITEAKIGNAAVTSIKIADASIVTAKIADATITSAKINSIDASKIVVNGATTLADWRRAGDLTKIDGGSVSANTVTANKMEIGLRGIQATGVVFEADPDTNLVSWTSGQMKWIDGAGDYQTVTVAAGNATWTSGIVYITWSESDTTLQITTVDATAAASDVVVLAKYEGGRALATDVGRTIIDGDNIRTGSISSGMGIFSGPIFSDNYVAGSAGWILNQNGDAEIRGLSADWISAGTLKVSRIVVGDNSNMIPDSSLADDASWTLNTSSGGAWALKDATASERAARVIEFDVATSLTGTASALYADAYMSVWVPIEPQRQYVIGGEFRNTTTSLGLVSTLVDWAQDGSQIAGSASVPLVVGDYDSEQSYSEVVTSPTGATHMRVRMRVAYNGDGDLVGTFRWYNNYLRPSIAQELSRPGSIPTGSLSVTNSSPDAVFKGVLNARNVEITELLSLDEDTAGFSLGKLSNADAANDGIYLGRTTGGGFGFRMGRTGAGGITQEIRADADVGLRFTNPQIYRNLESESTPVEITTTQTYAIPSGARALNLTIKGGGAGGNSGTVNGANEDTVVKGEVGGQTLVRLMDDGVFTGTSWYAHGGLNPTTSISGVLRNDRAAGYAGDAGEGNGGGLGGVYLYERVFIRETQSDTIYENRYTLDSGSNATKFGVGGGGGAAGGYGGAGGHEGNTTFVSDFEIPSGYTNPSLEVTIGAGGAGAVAEGPTYNSTVQPKNNPSRAHGGDGLPGGLIVTLESAPSLRADVIPLEATASGTVSKSANEVDYWPDLGAGFWVVKTAGTTAVGSVEINDRGDTVEFVNAGTVSFISSKTPVTEATAGTASITYIFHKMGD